MGIFRCKAFYCSNDINNKKKNWCWCNSKTSSVYQIFKRAYRLYDLKKRRIHESRDIIFIEEKVAYENIVNKQKVSDKFEYIDTTSKKNVIDKRVENNSEENPEE